MNYDEPSIALFLRIVACFMVVIAGLGCFVIALVSGILFTGVAMPFTLLGFAGVLLFIGTFLPPSIWRRNARGR